MDRAVKPFRSQCRLKPFAPMGRPEPAGILTEAEVAKAALDEVFGPGQRRGHRCERAAWLVADDAHDVHHGHADIGDHADVLIRHRADDAVALPVPQPAGE